MDKDWLISIRQIEAEELNRGILPQSFDNCAWRAIKPEEYVNPAFVCNVKGVDSIPARLPLEYIKVMEPWTDVYLHNSS